MELEEKYEEENRHNIDAAFILIWACLNKSIPRLVNAVLLEKIQDIEAFTFEKNRRLNKAVDQTLSKVSGQLEVIIANSMTKSWAMANIKNDKLVREYMRNIGMPELKEYFSHNIEALKAFVKRTEAGLNLSDRVWNIKEGFKTQLELYLRTGIIQGRSSSYVAMDIRQLLKDPDRLYRRVKNEVLNNGTEKLVLSKTARDYHPGQGVYRSSYRNALRLAATEINGAYRMSDYTRRQQLDFIRGFRVHLSRSHPRPDICDHMKGDYPPSFVFRGWHPWCLCYTTSILMSGAEYRKMKASGEKPKRFVRDMPEIAKKYIKENSEALNRLKAEPYFITDNPEIQRIINV
ncbi:MAG: hypothetical protein JXB00_07550 [Bacteroidales bacterium]|nr:hypothetical protein [Bacteroidales bacterium]